MPSPSVYMRLPLWLLVICLDAIAGHDVPASHDVPLQAGIGSSSALQRLEERQGKLAIQLQALTHTLDTQLEAGQLRDALVELREVLAESRGTNSGDYGAAQLSQQLQQTQVQLNETRHQLAAALQQAREAAQQTPPAVTTVLVERCSCDDHLVTSDEWRPADCAAVQQRHHQSGVYTIYPTTCGNGGGIRAYCDMTTAGGGWTVLMRRADVPHHQDFNMNWESYKYGFGNLSAEFWLGNEYISLLTTMDQMQLRVDLADWENSTAYAEYTPFSVDTEQHKYLVKLGKYVGTAGDAMRYNHGAQFSTKDRDHDTYKDHCAAIYSGAGWHKSCLNQNLLGPYMPKTVKKDYVGVIWKQWKTQKYSLKNAELKIRPVNYMVWCQRMASQGVSD